MKPECVALFTRDTPSTLDYSWRVHITPAPDGMSLFKIIVEHLNYALISNYREESPQFAFLLMNNRIGLLIGNLRTERKDYLGGVIYDTLYLECKAEERMAICNAVAAFLSAYDNNATAYQQHRNNFLEYAENIWNEKASLNSCPDIELPSFENNSSSFEENKFDVLISDSTFYQPLRTVIFKIIGDKGIAIYSDEKNRQECIKLLSRLSKTEHNDILIVSTGLVNREKIQEFAKGHREMIILVLSLSDSAKDGENLKRITNLIKAIRRMLPAIGSLFLVFLGIFFLTLDRTPPQLASLTLFSSNIIENAGKPIPRFGKGALQMTFSEAVQNVSLIVNQVGQHSSDPLEFASTKANQAETFEITLADVKDEAGNVMKPATFTAQIESAEIRAELFDAIRIVQKDGASFAAIQVKASAKYGVKAVSILDIPATQTQTPEVWQAEIPLPITPKMPLTAVIRDAHDNEIRVRLP